MTLDDLERRIQALSKVFKYPLLSQEVVKVHNSKLAYTFTAAIPNKSPLKILKKRERGRIQAMPKVFKYRNPLLSHERVKLRTSDLAGIHSQGPSEQKPN